MIFYVLAAMILGGYFVWAHYHKKRLITGEISLEDLSLIWLEDDQKVFLQKFSQHHRKRDQDKNDLGKDTGAEEIRKRDAGSARSPSIILQNKELEAFYDRHIDPYCRHIEMSRLWLPLVKILGLLDQYGQCSSINAQDGDQEFSTYKSVYKKLSNVTLVEHVINVSQILLGYVRKQEQECNAPYAFGKALIVGLGHDLGKIPALQRDRGYMGAHQIQSCAVLNALLDEDCPDKEEIMIAVREHHNRGYNHKMTSQLFAADSKAREIEIAKWDLQSMSIESSDSSQAMESPLLDDKPVGFSDEKKAPEPASMMESPKDSKETVVQTPPFPAPGIPSQDASSPQVTGPTDETEIDRPGLYWLDAEDLLRRIEPKINTQTSSGYFVAMSQKKSGIVYVMPSFISDTIFQMAEETGQKVVLDYKGTLEGRRVIEMKAVDLLRQRGNIPSMLGERYHSRKFKLINNKNKLIKIGMYTPIFLEAFKVSSCALEERKNRSARINEISEIIPA